ncbi:ATP-binding protein [Streptomyces violaceusniger]|uniref:ATP-binding protein n=1 Tax=Streptomyces violaceusniger TaxID=68280 RepID=UPI003440838F
MVGGFFPFPPLPVTKGSAPGPPGVWGGAPEPEAPRECGHGLLLVEELADRWGVVPELIGKTVWAEIGPGDLSRA